MEVAGDLLCASISLASLQLGWASGAHADSARPGELTNWWVSSSKQCPGKRCLGGASEWEARDRPGQLSCHSVSRVIFYFGDR
jgi:hypothetical protein